MKVYIAGPMTGIQDHNYPAFFDAESKLVTEGYDVINPAKLHIGLMNVKTWHDYMRVDIKHLLDCDAIYLLGGWELSDGANLERKIAIALGMKILGGFSEQA